MTVYEFWYICTMFVKKAPNSASPVRAHRKQLEYLYARRSAIDALIQTLEDYGRFRSMRVSATKRKSA